MSVGKEDMKVFWAKYKLAIVIVVIIVVIAVGIAIYYSVRNNAIATGASQGVRNVIATIPNTSTTAPYTQAELLQIGQLATEVENDFSGFWWTVTFVEQPITDMVNATDRVLQGTYLQYKQDRPSQDLIADLESLSYLPGFGGDRDTVVARLKTLIFAS